MNEYDFILDTLTKAGALLLAEREKGFETNMKGGDPRDIVTSVDMAVNDFLIKSIQEHFPNDSIYSEESTGDEHMGTREWVLDPIDGSSNFSRNIPHFAIALGILENEAPLVGGIYNPITKELFSFEKGKGAFLNGAPIHVSQKETLMESCVFLHAGRKPDVWAWGGESYTKLLEHAQKTCNFSGSALDVCFLAAGRIEAVVYGRLTTRDLGPAAGILIEAGGMITDPHGNDITFSKEPQKVFATNNATISKALLELIGN